MYKRWKVQVHITSDGDLKKIESYIRAHSLTEALNEVLPLYSNQAGIVGVTATNAGKGGESEAPPPPSKRRNGRDEQEV